MQIKGFRDTNKSTVGDANFTIFRRILQYVIHAFNVLIFALRLIPKSIYKRVRLQR